MNMFCYQCEQTAHGSGCEKMGVCGKDPTTAALQDLLVHAVKGVSMYAHRAAELGRRDAEVDRFAVEALFATVTNVDFDPERLSAHLCQAKSMQDRAREMYEQACAEAGKQPESLGGPAKWAPARGVDGLLGQAAAEASIARRKERLGDVVTGLQELALYGLKGAAAYADHAAILGEVDPKTYAEFHAVLAKLGDEPTSVDELFALSMRVGELNYHVMQALDAGHVSHFGSPQPTPVRVEPVKGKAICVSGHDLLDLEMLLKQTEGKGINIYTHGEMLPAHGYPELKKYKHLVGNYGGAWQDQAKEFDAFPGAILMTTNCIQRPRDSYKDRLFTTGLVAWPGVRHIDGGPDKDFTPVIEAALAAESFAEDGPDKEITVGFARDAVMGVAETVVEAVKGGAIRHFFLVGGCDGAKPGRNYYTEFAQAVPDDCVILTLACGKYRFNKLDFGDIGGVPRLLDVGQCNDAYSAIEIAKALAGVFETDVNGLPLSMVLSWYEQKACAILLTLLWLGVRDIRLGPSLPAFVTPPVLDALVEKFNLMPISSPQEDLRAILGEGAAA